MLRVIISDPTAGRTCVDPRQDFVQHPRDQGRRLPARRSCVMPKTTFISLIPRRNGAGIQPARQFVRYLGNFHGENMYERPTGIAIDRKAAVYIGRYSTQSRVYLDLHGNVLKRLGRDRHGNGSGDFASPNADRRERSRIVVLDAEGSRIQVLDSTATALLLSGCLSA